MKYLTTAVVLSMLSLSGVASAQTYVNTGTNVDVNLSDERDTSSGTVIELNTNLGATASSSTSSDANGSVGLQGTVTLGSASSVVTNDDLSVYAETVNDSSESIDTVEVNSDSVVVTYTEPGRFLWIFPVKVTSTITLVAKSTGIEAQGKSSAMAYFTHVDRKADTVAEEVESEVNGQVVAKSSAHLYAEALKALEARVDSSVDVSAY